MSVEVIQEIPMENNDIKSFENLSSINEKQIKMDDDQPENKSKSEVETLQTIFNSDCKFNKFQNNSIGPGTSSKIQSPAKSETASSAKKASHHHTPKSKVQENFRNALLIDDDKTLSEELPDIVKVNPLPQQVLSTTTSDSPTTTALKALEKLKLDSTQLSVNPTSSTEHSDEEFTECQSYSALHATSTKNWEQSQNGVGDELPPDSTTKSANTTQEIVDSSNKNLSLTLNKSFPVIKSPPQTTFPVSPTPDAEIKEYTKENGRQSITTLNGTFAASSEALNSTINLNQDNGLEAEDRQNVANCTASFMSANATIPMHKMDSGFASTNLEENHNVTASFESANQTMNIELNTTNPVNSTLPMNSMNVTTSEDQSNQRTFVPEDNDLNVTTSGINEVPEKPSSLDNSEINTTTDVETLQKSLKDVSVTLNNEEKEVNTTTCLEDNVEQIENVANCKGNESYSENDANRNTNEVLSEDLPVVPDSGKEQEVNAKLSETVDMQESMSMDVDMEDLEENNKQPEPTEINKDCNDCNENVLSPMEVEENEIVKPESLRDFDNQIFLSDKEKSNLNNEKEEKEEKTFQLEDFNAEFKIRNIRMKNLKVNQKVYLETMTLKRNLWNQNKGKKLFLSASQKKIKLFPNDWSEKEQLSQNFEKELNEIKADRDSNYYHLTSLETTFSDLNIKYEKNKELLSQVKASEEKLLTERKVEAENLKMQEQRYEKMKSHAMMQLEIANQKIEDFRKQHTLEVTRLKALLKKEEISRAAVSDQLQQKTKENEQLMKICDELINSQQPS
uniref:Transforming acidic coiled-coil-containing protein C-terminal domain-containing protein n=1 Tax=Megaselia scalaris TaxID=36166 RepID=T1GES0_MEGSC